MKIDISPQYLAGVIDSDGAISITKRHLKRRNPNYTVMIQIGWVLKPISKDFMEALVKKYGGSIFTMGSRKNSFGTKKHIKYTATGVAASKILNDIKPYLILKSEQCDNALAARAIAISVNARLGKKRPDNVSNELERLFIANRLINDKNGYSNDKVS